MESVLRSCITIILFSAVMTDTWPSWTYSGFNLKRMLLSEDGENLFVVGGQSVYQLRSSDLSLIATYTQHDFMLTVAFNNDMDTITICSNGTDPCVMHKALNVTEVIEEHSGLSIRTANATTLVADDTLFIACPHNDNNEPCETPGIIWKKYDKVNTRFTSENYKFIKMNVQNVQMETIKYLAAIAVGKHRLFFSIQKVGDGNLTTRIAQLCQKSTYQMQYTYVDMEIHCGNETEAMLLTDVTTFTFNDTIHIAGVFNSNRSSAICVYPFWQVVNRFIQNFKVCHMGSKGRANSDYFSQHSARRCHSTSTIPEDDYLCEGYEGYYNVIGNYSLDASPVLEFQTSIQSIAIVEKSSEIIAFLGTANNGQILKAVVYPPLIARELPTNISMGYGKIVKEDMYISADKAAILAMTNNKVARIPVQQCSMVQGCEACLQGKDPYCGWCILKNRCTILEECGEDWIQAKLPTSTCPSILEVSMPYIPADHQTLLDITLSHLPHLADNVSLVCHFHTSVSEMTFNRNISATRIETEQRHIQCQTPDIQSIANNIEGTLLMNLSILTTEATEPFAEGYVTYYSCETFNRCDLCVQKEWRCDWCIYQERCETMESSNNCSQTLKIPHTEISGTGSCPVVTDIKISARKDNSDTYFLSADSFYTVQIIGSYFPKPMGNTSYICLVPMINNAIFPAHYENDTLVKCFINGTQLTHGQVEPELHLNFGSLPVLRSALKVTFYDCELMENSCGKCKSLAEYQPYIECHWCSNKCISTEHTCPSSNNVCPPPNISKVFPMSAVINASTRVTIEGINLGSTYNETINAVTIGDRQCSSVEEKYVPSESISCDLEASSVEMAAAVNVTLPNKEPVLYGKFHFRVPRVLGISPTLGPQSGGTHVTISGQYLHAGNERTIFLGSKICETLTLGLLDSGNLACMTTKVEALPGEPLTVQVKYENSTVIEGDNVTYRYVTDPEIKEITPLESFIQGGRRLTVRGTNLHSIQRPLIYATFANGRKSNESECVPESETTIFCKSPVGITSFNNPMNLLRTQRAVDRPPESARLSFVMDGVQSVKDLDEKISTIFYYQNPVIHEFSRPEQYHDILVIKGERLAVAADQDDVIVLIGTAQCNVTSLKNDSIYCNPPGFSAFISSESSIFPIKVRIGNFHSYAGLLQYATPITDDDEQAIKIIGGVIASVVLLVFITLSVILWRTSQKRRAASKEKKGLEYRLDKLEATFRTQCREEFAALQTAVSDLTSDLEGGNVLFRDYHVYACKTLFSSSRSQHTIMSHPQELANTSIQALDNFKALLRNTAFLLMFIRTLEKEKTFTIQDKSHVATILMVLNHDNLEFITDILKTLLGELVDKNVATQSPKLLLRRSESVSEKLLTHWLSICLYHYLKDSSGSSLYILYKAIKTQVEKGPVDYITGCGKYTLSEDRLFTSADTAVNAKPLVLQVTHFHYIDNEEKLISATVLDCDTITQAKAKMLEILYKNVPYSQRPPVHKTMLQIQEPDGTVRTLNDEDASSIKDGLWKKINTLLHYGVDDGTKASLIHSKEMAIGSCSLAEVSPDAYIVGSYRKSRPAVRTISGSNYWHLTKQNIGEDEVKISSDFFLPRLINTKGTLQTYIDDLFTAILSVGDEPPIIIKYLYDFLDAAAQRHGITDPDVLHTWKCNSVLLRFWVNILKNPEFVFDIHKPQIVDACLSVVAQTLMDSCSTADLKLGPLSPSNKLLFAKDIPRYKTMVKTYFEEIKNKPSVSDQDLNSYLTERVSQKFSGEFNITSALLEMYKYAVQYKVVLMNEMDNLEASSPGSFFPLSSKLEGVFACMELK